MRYLATSDFVFPIIITGVRGKVWFCHSNHDFICRAHLFGFWCVIFSFIIGPIVKVSAISCDQIWKFSKPTVLTNKADTVRWNVRLLHCWYCVVRGFLFVITWIWWWAMPGNLLVIVFFVCPSRVCLNNVRLIWVFAEYLFILNIRVCWPICGWAPA